jgi:hypothetical protein
MFDAAPLTIEEIVDHFRALAQATLEITHPTAKELLLFILAERLDLLYRSLNDVIVVEDGNHE